MGRKIPGKKHRGVKDPTKQQAKRLSELKTKINAPPKDKEEQTIPKSLERVMKLKEGVKAGRIGPKKTKKKKKKSKDALIVAGLRKPMPLHPKARPDKVVPVFSQRPDESGRQFLNRVNLETQAFINETAFEDKYGVDIKRDPRTGEVEGLARKAKDELDELAKLRMKHKNTNKKKKKKKKKDGEETVVKLTKSQKRKRKLEMRKTKKLQDNIDEFKVFKENVEFGDVVHAPPELKARPRKSDDSNSGRPGRKDLLLNSLFDKDAASKTKPSPVSLKKSGKRKDLPVGERRQLEKEQTQAIAAYRLLKSKQGTLP